jgi:hypothetical protein
MMAGAVDAANVGGITLQRKGECGALWGTCAVVAFVGGIADAGVVLYLARF